MPKESVFLCCALVLLSGAADAAATCPEIGKAWSVSGKLVEVNSDIASGDYGIALDPPYPASCAQRNPNFAYLSYEGKFDVLTLKPDPTCVPGMHVRAEGEYRESDADELGIISPYLWQATIECQ